MSLKCKGFKTMISFSALTATLFLDSCNADKKNNEKSGDEVIAVINNDCVYYSDIDKQVKQQIFDELNRIYTIRQLALDEAEQGGPTWGPGGHRYAWSPDSKQIAVVRSEAGASGVDRKSVV